MIRSRKDYIYYWESDKKSMGLYTKSAEKKAEIYNLIGGLSTYKLQKLLRKAEYYTNCSNCLRNKLLGKYYRWRYMLYSQKLLISVPLNVCGPGLSLAKTGPIRINSGCVIGKNCRIHISTNIATSAGKEDKAPTIGDNVYIGPGAKLFGPIKIADNIAIGANAVVTKSFEEPGITIGGIPAKKISDKGSEGLLIKGTEFITGQFI
jgi:serine O-acetyltransferase